MINIRTYESSDWEAIERVHDSARKIELHLAGLDTAFLPLKIAAESEDLFDYPGLFVAELDGMVVGFAACNEEELAWVYVHPDHFRKGIGRALSQHAITVFPGIDSIEALKGNEPARRLYESLGFEVKGIIHGRMPGNEEFEVDVYDLRRDITE